MQRITTFRNEHAFLSNFYPAWVRLGGAVWPTVEQAFVAAKTVLPEERARVLACATPAEAKRLGRTLTLRPGWDTLRLDVMEALLRQKFRPGTALCMQLLATGDAALIEANRWGDCFWGVDARSGQGENHLGRLLEQVRAERQQR